MSTSVNFISGWTPTPAHQPDGDSHCIPSPSESCKPYFATPEPTFIRTSSIARSIRNGRYPLKSPTPPSKSSSWICSKRPRGKSDSPTLTSSERRALKNRLINPFWVARPKNAFIIFRCEYSKKHARKAMNGRPLSPGSTRKSLSKRASDAWKMLSAEEKKVYEVRAERERTEHALKNPCYKFTPLRRSSYSLDQSALPSRYEQAASHVMQSTRSRSSLDTSDYDLPTFASFSSQQFVAAGFGFPSRRSSYTCLSLDDENWQADVAASCVSSPGPNSTYTYGLVSRDGACRASAPALFFGQASVANEPLPTHPSLVPLSDERLFDGYSFDTGLANVRSIPSLFPNLWLSVLCRTCRHCA
jgi:HMG (high mobility group) box